MNKQLIIGCDADGILTDLSAHNLRAGRQVFRREPVCPEGYSLEEMFDVSDISKPMLYAKALVIFCRYCKNEPLRPFAPETIRTLSAYGFEFHAITARKFAASRSILGKIVRRWFMVWLRQNGIKFASIHFCDEARSLQDKLLACRKLGVDAMIEDKPEIAMHLAKNGIRVIMIDAPYNVSVQHELITHVLDWNGIASVFREIQSYNQTFVKKDRSEIAQLSNNEKTAYFRAYQRHLQRSFFNTEKFRKGDRLFTMLYRMMQLPLSAFYRVKISGKENIPYQNGFIIACNHCDSTDQYRLGLALGARPFVGYAAKEIVNTVRGRLFSCTGLGLFIDRKDHADKQSAAEQMAVYVAHDRTALLFPEGTRKNKTLEGRQRFQNRFQLGTAALAQKTGTGILPAAVNAFGRDTFIRFGELIYVSPTDDICNATKHLELAVAELSLANYTEYLKKKPAVLEQVQQRYKTYLAEIEGGI